MPLIASIGKEFWIFYLSKDKAIVEQVRSRRSFNSVSTIAIRACSLLVIASPLGIKCVHPIAFIILLNHLVLVTVNG
jgi:hypothetical protein